MAIVMPVITGSDRVVQSCTGARLWETRGTGEKRAQQRTETRQETGTMDSWGTRQGETQLTQFHRQVKQDEDIPINPMGSHSFSAVDGAVRLFGVSV